MSPAEATVIAFRILAYGLLMLPSPVESLPVRDTNQVEGEALTIGMKAGMRLINNEKIRNHISSFFTLTPP